MAQSKLDMLLNLKSRLSRPLNKVRGKLGRLNEKAVQSQKKVNQLGGSFQNLKSVATGALSGIAAAGFGVMLDQVGKAQNQVANLTGASGDMRERLTQDVVSIADTYRVQYNDVIKANDNLTDQLGGSHEKNMKLLRKSLKRSVGDTGEFLDQIREFPSALADMGISAEQTMAVMLQSRRQGVFSDKGIDAVKEAGIELRRMPDNVKKTMNSIDGIDANAIQKRIQSGTSTMFEEVRRISSKMDELGKQDVGKLMEKLFKGPGEDAIGFVKSLGDMNLEIDKTKNNTTDYIKFKRELLGVYGQLKVVLFQQIVPALLDMVNFLKENKEVIKGLIPAVAGLAAGLATYYGWLLATQGVTKLLTVATAAYNAVLYANPIGIIAVAIGGLIAVLGTLYTQFESVRAVIHGVWASIKQVFSNIVTTVKKLPKIMLDSFKAVPKAIFNLFEGVGDFFSALFSGNFGKIPGIIKGIGESIAKTNPFYNAAGQIGAQLGKGVGSEFNKAFETELSKSSEAAGKKDQSEKGGLLKRSMSSNQQSDGGDEDDDGGEQQGAETKSVVGGGAKKKILNVQIGSVNGAQGDFVVNTTNLQEGTNEMSKQLEEALIRAMRNFENSV